MYDMYVLGSYRWRVLGIYMEISGHSIPKRGILEVDLEYGSMYHTYTEYIHRCGEKHTGTQAPR